MKSTQKRVLRGAIALAVSAGFIVSELAPAHAAATSINVWAMCSEIGEVKAVKEQTEAFNTANAGKITANLLCKADMGKTISATPSRSLGDVFEFDGETLAFQVYNGKLAALDGVVSKATLDNELVSIQAQGKYKNRKTYSVSQYDSGLALYGSKSALAAAGVTNIPTTWDKAWTADEFTKVLEKLAAKASGGKAIDIKENYGIGGGWAGYGFAPIVNSAGYPLIGSNGLAVGSLDAKPVVSAFEKFASWKKYVDPSADDKAFENKRVGLAWVGHWQAPAFKKSHGTDLVVIPLPDFGQGTKSGQGSHSWALRSTITGAKKAAATAYLEFIMQDKWVLNTTDQNGAVPATKTALAKSTDYKKGGLLELYGQQLAASCGVAKPTKACVTVPRTISAAWPVINSTFSKAVAAIYGGADAQTELTKAAKAIDLDAKDNNYYK
jgi:multiple sugar transport system substrate-binding protein